MRKPANGNNYYNTQSVFTKKTKDDKRAETLWFCSVQQRRSLGMKSIFYKFNVENESSPSFLKSTSSCWFKVELNIKPKSVCDDQNWKKCVCLQEWTHTQLLLSTQHFFTVKCIRSENGIPFSSLFL